MRKVLFFLRENSFYCAVQVAIRGESKSAESRINFIMRQFQYSVNTETTIFHPASSAVVH